jgi:hypothetical protein
MLVLGIFIFGLMLGFLNVKGLDNEVQQYLLKLLDDTCGEAWKENYWAGISWLLLLSSRQKPFECLVAGLTVIGLPLIMVVIFLRSFSLDLPWAFSFSKSRNWSLSLFGIGIAAKSILYSWTSYSWSSGHEFFS